MTLESVLLFLSCASIGLMAGIYVCGWIHDHRIADLSAREYVAVHQMRSKRIRAHFQTTQTCEPS